MSGVAKYGTAHRSSTSPEPRAATLVSWRRRFEKRADDEERGAVHRSLPESPASPAQPQTRLSPADIAMNTRIFRVERLSLQKQLHSIFVTPRNLASLLSRQAPSNGIIAHDYRDRFA